MTIRTTLHSHSIATCMPILDSVMLFTPPTSVQVIKIKNQPEEVNGEVIGKESVAPDAGRLVPPPPSEVFGEHGACQEEQEPSEGMGEAARDKERREKDEGMQGAWIVVCWSREGNGPGEVNITTVSAELVADSPLVGTAGVPVVVASQALPIVAPGCQHHRGVHETPDRHETHQHCVRR